MDVVNDQGKRPKFGLGTENLRGGCLRPVRPDQGAALPYSPSNVILDFRSKQVALSAAETILGFDVVKERLSREVDTVVYLHGAILHDVSYTAIARATSLHDDTNHDVPLFPAPHTVRRLAS